MVTFGICVCANSNWTIIYLRIATRMCSVPSMNSAMVSRDPRWRESLKRFRSSIWDSIFRVRSWSMDNASDMLLT